MLDIVTSNTCGYCDGSIGVVYRAATPGVPGPDTQWKRDIVSGYSCGGQVEGVLPLTDPATGEVNYVWHSTTVRKSSIQSFPNVSSHMTTY